MTVTLAMPQLGLTMTEATVGVWLKKPGDTVSKDEAVLSISTDKVDMDIESNVDGILRVILVQEGQTVPVGTALAHIDAGKDPSTTAPLSSPPPAAGAGPAVDVEGNPAQVASALEKEQRGDSLRSSPRARRKARELGIDLANVKGSGPEGRIVEQDLMNLAPVRSAVSQAGSKRRQVIAESMLESIRTIPAFSVSLEVNAEQLVSLYQSLKEPIGRRAGSRLTYTDLLFRALALSLADTPAMNAVWQAGEVRPRDQIVLGLAVATIVGLWLPSLRESRVFL